MKCRVQTNGTPHRDRSSPRPQGPPNRMNATAAGRGSSSCGGREERLERHRGSRTWSRQVPWAGMAHVEQEHSCTGFETLYEIHPTSAGRNRDNECERRSDPFPECADRHLTARAMPPSILSLVAQGVEDEPTELETGRRWRGDDLADLRYGRKQGVRRAVACVPRSRDRWPALHAPRRWRDRLRPPSLRHSMMDAHETDKSSSARVRHSPHDRVLRWRLALGIITFAFGVVALILLATTGDASSWATVSAVLSIPLGLIAAISGWRDLRDVPRARAAQPTV